MPPAQRVSGGREKDGSHEIQVGERIAVRVIDAEMPALFLLVAIGPLVVTGSVDERVLEPGPQIGNGKVVALGAELTARMDVTHLEHEIDLRILVARVDERRRSYRAERYPWATSHRASRRTLRVSGRSSSSVERGTVLRKYDPPPRSGWLRRWSQHAAVFI